MLSDRWQCVVDPIGHEKLAISGHASLKKGKKKGKKGKAYQNKKIKISKIKSVIVTKLTTNCPKHQNIDIKVKRY